MSTGFLTVWESGVLRRNGSMITHQESNASKDKKTSRAFVLFRLRPHAFWQRKFVFSPHPRQPFAGGRNNGEAQLHHPEFFLISVGASYD
jgi:hypothetical protein